MYCVDMRKIMLLLGLMLMAGVVNAKPVDASVARRVAEVYLRAQGMGNVGMLVDITSQTPFTEFYVFASEEGGFILVSADDCVAPVLGYSISSRFETKNIPDHVRGWYEAYENEIRIVRTSGEGAVDEVSQQWQMLLAGDMPPAPLTTSVSPMMTTTWSQGSYYNNLCPYHTGTSARSVTGCVATATAQVMKYWNHPTTGYGNHTYTSERTRSGVTYTFPNLTADFGATTYQWSNMPNALTSVSSSSQVNAVATLMYHLGVAVEMSYSPEASGAQNYNTRGRIAASSQSALMKYFKYRADMAALCREDYSDAVFCERLRDEIDQSRPFLYSGSHTSGAHSFVFDGYDNYGKFHVNWGWGGSHDGYFVVGSLNPGTGGIGGNSSGTYNMGNVALVGIQPHSGWDTTGTTTVTVTTSGNGSVTGSGSYAFGDTVSMLATANSGYRFGGWSDGCKFNPREIIANGGSYTFTATFEPVTGDTLHFCPGNHYITAYGYSSGGENYWGIHLNASMLNADSSLKAVQHYVSEAGTYDLTVYTGAYHSTIAARDTVTYSANDEDQWRTITLTNPVPATSDLWIIFHFSGAGYPQSGTYYSGAAGSFISGSNFNDNSESRRLSAMVKGIFCACVAPVDSSCYITSFPYTEDFESGLFGCWEVNDVNGDGNTWEFNSSNGYNGSACFRIHWADYCDDWLMTPPIAVAGNYTISWKARAHSSSYPESYQVLWHSGTDTTLLFQETLSTTTYVNRTANFTVPVGGSGRVVFRHISEDMYYLYLDNVTIAQLSVPDQYTVTVESNNPAWGTVTGSGTYLDGATATLTATPAEGYRFVQWQDGDIHATRDVVVVCDTVFTATFEAIPQYMVTVNRTCANCSEDIPADFVSGEGTYTEGSTVTLEGQEAGCDISFVFWINETGDTIYENPYSFVINSNRILTAVFSFSGGIDDVNLSVLRLYPNPASDHTTIVVDEGLRMTDKDQVCVLDATGRTVLTQTIACAGSQTIALDVSALPSGLYFVKVGAYHASLLINR